MKVHGELGIPDSNKEKNSHYKTGEVEPIHLIESQKLGFAEGNIVKYICRLGKKDDPLQEIRKIRDYLDIIEKRYSP